MKFSETGQRTKAAIFLATVMLLVSVAARAAEQPAEQYRCVSEASTGFSYDELSRKWVPKHFNTNTRWVIRFDKVWKKIVVVVEGGKSEPLRCEERSPGSTLFNCTGFGEFSFNFANGRFVARGFHGYLFPDIAGHQEGDTDEWTEIGHCRPL